MNQIKVNDKNTSEINLNCDTLSFPRQEEITDDDSCTSSSSKSCSQLHVSLLSEVMKRNTVIDTVHVDPEIFHMLDDATCKDLFAAIGSLSNLRALEIHGKRKMEKLQITWLTKALQEAVNLRSLRLSNTEFVGTEDDFMHFNDALLLLSCSTLKKFISHQILLPRCYGLDNLIGQALSKTPSQSSLEDIMIIPFANDQQQMNSSTKAIKSLCNISTIKRLSLNGFRFCQEHLVGIAHALADPNTSLEYLNLSCNRLTDKDFLIIAYALELSCENNTTRLTGLNIADNKLKNETGVVLGRILSIKSKLKLLNLSDNRIGDKGGVAIAKALFVNDSLEKLSLRHCSLGDDTIVSIAGSFHINNTLNKLNIKDNRRIKNMLSYRALLEAKEKSTIAAEIAMDFVPIVQQEDADVSKLNIYTIPSTKLVHFERNDIVTLMNFIAKAA